MHIVEALSYGDAWARLSTQYSEQLRDIQSAVAEFTDARVARAKPTRPGTMSESLARRYQLDDCWQELIRERGWKLPPRNVVPTAGGRHLSLRRLGNVNGRVSTAFIRHKELLNQWLYTTAPVASRVGAIDIPVALVLMQAAQLAFMGRASPRDDNVFELTRDELVALSPLSHASPFLILGLSPHAGTVNITDLTKESGIEFRQIVMNRSIEFPPQYHQAGLGVLTYFGTVLREKYPNHNAKVRIEQDGLTVRLVIESENGDREIIEKALQEYEMVVVGERPPESLSLPSARIVELKNELRIAQVRIESQRDIIALQGEQISSLRELIGHSLSRPPSPIAVNVQPVLTVNNAMKQSVEVNPSLPELSDDVRELVTMLNDDSLKLRLLDLSESLDVAAEKTSSEAVRESPGLSKLRAFLEDANKVGTKANDLMSKVENGVDVLQNLGRKYNAVAEWCGLPQVPRAFLGKDT